jgi:5-methyltetrahydropteroyltriglutamate--homocysteine methyltransferase
VNLSTERILTTHVGSLPRPPALSEAVLRRENGQLRKGEAAQLPTMIAEAVAGVVRRQVDAGTDVVSDGEMSKIGYATYVKERLSGFDGDVEVPPGGGLSIADLDDYPGMAERSLAGLETATPPCTGPVKYVGADLLEEDMARFRAALGPAGATEAFLNAASPGVISLYLPNLHYETHDEYLFALAEAMREEYEAITAAGFVLQIDAPDLAMGRHIQYAGLGLEDFQARCRVHVEAINSAVRNIDPDRMRLHVCWGNYQGTHHRDVALADIIRVVLGARPQALCFEAANHRHAHEWKVFEDVELPGDKVLVPGFIDTSSNYIDHPELIAERIIRFAELVGRDRIIAGTDCGFSSFATFLAVESEIAWAKLAALAEGAQLASDRLW